MMISTVLFFLAGSVAATGLPPWELEYLWMFNPPPPNSPTEINSFQINATIHDPNTTPSGYQTPSGEFIFPPSTANCTAQWLSTEDPPYGVPLPCSQIEYGQWSMVLSKGNESDPLADIHIDFNLYLVSDPAHPDRNSKRFTSSTEFRVGTNTNMFCTTSACDYLLIDPPFYVYQTEED